MPRAGAKVLVAIVGYCVFIGDYSKYSAINGYTIGGCVHNNHQKMWSNCGQILELWSNCGQLKKWYLCMSDQYGFI